MLCVIYKSRKFLGRQKWRWHVIAANNKKMCHSGEAFTNLQDARENAEEVLHPSININIHY